MLKSQAVLYLYILILYGARKKILISSHAAMTRIPKRLPRFNPWLVVRFNLSCTGVSLWSHCDQKGWRNENIVVVVVKVKKYNGSTMYYRLMNSILEQSRLALNLFYNTIT